MSTNPYLQHTACVQSKKRPRLDLNRPRKKLLGSKAAFHSQGAKEKKKEKATKYIFGNYPQYYGYRNKRKDPRLELIQKWVEGKVVLDIGCNAGYVAVELALRHRPKEIIGVDIDETLITKSWAHLKHQARLLNQDGVSHDNPPLPHNIQFRACNWVQDDEECVSKYDVILCLSVTKWIHLNQGDGGIKQLFQKIHDSLSDDGVFILEPQPWSSYYRRSHLTPEIWENYKRIQLRPEQFEVYLTHTIGFQHCELLGVPETDSKGFSRPLYLFRKLAK
ncbi:Bin3-domain-containing protein [Basidiobolus meristosporus CBS 931.73]|uniref:RNA methyltransferase n=1 Tax=Basidiobolus meristosporus CBS 931.73 TaxID=1314790 RepID=A0A1Y1Y4X0_9FUNG|nr:Bin3-domain-containing protein [Basidiobolus meristosporus CBS 931.73]|eukprot:ORX93037.1 Bin3-domain-containing protein [Basidiobolus meristosporus CBS 931.73]